MDDAVGKPGQDVEDRVGPPREEVRDVCAVQDRLEGREDRDPDVGAQLLGMNWDE